jgi:hypothetical protein
LPSWSLSATPSAPLHHPIGSVALHPTAAALPAQRRGASVSRIDPPSLSHLFSTAALRKEVGCPETRRVMRGTAQW